MKNKTELINTILDCVNDSIDLDNNKVSLGILITLLNDNIPEQLTIGGVVSSLKTDNKISKYVINTDSSINEYEVRLREDNSILFAGTLPECYAWVNLQKDGCF